MKKTEKSLQRLTEPENDKVTITDTYKFFKNKFGWNREEVHQNGELMLQQYLELQGEEKDELVRYMFPLINDDLKNAMWEMNHSMITRAVSMLVNETGRIPSQSEIAHKTKLSRQTVNKHMKQFKQQPASKIETAKYDIMAENVIAKVYSCAKNGDMKAARLFFDFIGKNNLKPQGNYIQNNYVQINNITLSQENIRKLSPEKLKVIESTVKDILKEGEQE